MNNQTDYKQRKTDIPDPQIGQTYVFKEDVGNPFTDLICTVQDVKNGFVKYSWTGIDSSQYCSQTVKWFNDYYVPYTEE